MELVTIPKLGADPDFPLSAKQIRNLIKENRIPYVRFGVRYLLNPDKVLEALDREAMLKH